MEIHNMKFIIFNLKMKIFGSSYYFTVIISNNLNLPNRIFSKMKLSAYYSNNEFYWITECLLNFNDFCWIFQFSVGDRYESVNQYFWIHLLIFEYDVHFRSKCNLISHFRIFYFDSKMIIFGSKLKFIEIYWNLKWNHWNYCNILKFSISWKT